MRDADWVVEQQTLEAATESLRSVRRAMVGAWLVRVTLRPGGFRAEAQRVHGEPEQWLGAERSTLSAATFDAIEWAVAHAVADTGSSGRGATSNAPEPPEEWCTANRRAGGRELWGALAVWAIGLPLLFGVVGLIGLGAGFAEDSGQHPDGRGETIAALIGGFVVLTLMSWAILSPVAEESDQSGEPPASGPAVGDPARTESRTSKETARPDPDGRHPHTNGAK